jgi:hypothetical protein
MKRASIRLDPASRALDGTIDGLGPQIGSLLTESKLDRCVPSPSTLSAATLTRKSQGRLAKLETCQVADKALDCRSPGR